METPLLFFLSFIVPHDAILRSHGLLVVGGDTGVQAGAARRFLALAQKPCGKELCLEARSLGILDELRALA